MVEATDFEQNNAASPAQEAAAAGKLLELNEDAPGPMVLSSQESVATAAGDEPMDTAAEEEKKGEEPEETKEYEEIAPDANLSEIFVNLDSGVPSDVIQSLCMECQRNGETRFMYTKIPMFKEIILSSFACEHEDCGFRNNEVQFGGKLSDYGCKY